MISVALTGNVASGKSTVARLFASWGATLIDADSLVREVQQPGSPVLDAIRARFGPGMIRADGSLDREALRRVILADPRARADLEAIVHPPVQRRRAELLAQARARGDRIVVQDIPLLFEALDPAAFDVVVLVDAPEPVRRTRLIGARGLDPAEADRLIAAQLPSGPKRARSHIVIDNDGSRDELRARAAEAWQRLLDLPQPPR
ncbi:MAG TPA: dephospho-CoA kinase [Gemmatimonadales bacterium]|nr:dephospho-CoA kinase [Gemmatimonadales bacterium]